MADSDFLKCLNKKLGGRSLYLVGMMGSGKSKTGPVLAKKLSYAFVDSDDVIEKYAKKSIPEIFKDEGESTFRDIEKYVLTAISQRHSLVVATGGGVVLSSENWGVLHQGIVIWINTERQTIFDRLKVASVKRPLLDHSDFESDFDQIFTQRRNLYMQADIQIDVIDQTPEEVSTLILNKISSVIQDPVEQQTIE